VPGASSELGRPAHLEDHDMSGILRGGVLAIWLAAGRR